MSSIPPSASKHGPEPRAPFSLAAAFLFLGVQSATSGDILRGGAAATNGNRTAGPNAASAQAAAQARSNAQDALARTSRAVEAVQRAQQSAARAAAGANNAGPDPTRPGFMLPDVPNGLAPGGLQVAPGVGTDLSLWTGAFLPTQTSSGGKTQVTVKQTSQQALLNWQTFNVGKDTNLHFDQSAGGTNVGQWIAFNKVNDPTGRPSQILGSITAPGQVYVINQNGIIFGGASQVNTHTLVASALPINDNLITRGLLNQSTTAQFLFSGLPQAGDVPFTPPPPPPGGKYGDVTVLPGAQLGAPTTEANVGGRIALVGANVTNRGRISTPDGQTILAAGLQVGFAAHSSTDATLRGLDTYVGAVGDYAGRVENLGIIDIPRGSATLTGRDILQAGAIDGTTSVSLNGRIDLRAEYNAVPNTNYDPVNVPDAVPFLYGGSGAATSTGNIRLGAGSVLRVLPEWGSQDRVVGTSLALKSQINLRGKTILMEPDAAIHAPSGNVSLSTGVWDFVGTGTSPTSTFVRSGGQIYLDRGALINVAGTPDAFAPLSQNILTVTLRASELADSPLQRDTFFRGGDITVDLRKTGTYNGREWIGTPLADLRGYLNLIERTVDELTVSGGTINLNSGGSIIVQPGANLDVSAGWINYGGGTVRTTRLLYRGQLVDIANAAPDRLYDGIYTGEFIDRHPRWNVERTYRVPWMTGEHYEAGYLQGADAGRLALSASSTALDGSFRGGAVSGLRQTVNPAKGGTFDLSYEIQQLVAGSPADPLFSPAPPVLTFGSQRQAPAGSFALDVSGNPVPLRADRVAQVTLDPDLLAAQGFASVSVRNPDGDIEVPRGIALNAPARGSIRLEGANIKVAGKVEAPGGSLTFLAYNLSPSVAEALRLSSNPVLPAVNPARGQFSLEPGAVINAAGLVVDQRSTQSSSFYSPHAIDGGSVLIRSYSADLAAGGLIDVSGGVLAGPRGGFSYGKAGSLEIQTGQDLTLGALDGGRLKLESTLRGYSGTGTGGTLSLQAQLIRIGGSPLHPLTLQLDPDFFSQGGFSAFNLIGIGALDPASGGENYLPAVSVAAGTLIHPAVSGWLAQPFGGPGGTLALTPFIRPEGLRAPLSLTLNAKGLRNELAGNELRYRGDVLIESGAEIRTDALGSIRLTGDTVAVLGSLTAPAGRIVITGANSLPARSAGVTALTTVYLGPGARISAAGTTVAQLDRFGRLRGNVFPGGSISVSGNIVAERGAVLDVSGTTGVLDLHPWELGLDASGRLLVPGSRLVPPNSGITAPLVSSLSYPVRLDSAGGSISLRGGEMLFTDATLRGHAGGPTAQGGSLTVSSGRFVLPGASSNTAETNLNVTQSGINLPVPFAATGRSGIGQAPRDAAGAVIPGMGYFSANAFASGGFASLTLGGNVEFKGPVTLAADNILRVATGGVIRADAPVYLQAEYVALGQAFLPPLRPEDSRFLFTQSSSAITGAEYNFAPTFGPGELHVRAQQIDLGTLSLGGIGLTTLNAGSGDLRGNGTFQAAGRIVINAGQIYPTTGSPFNLLAYPGGGQEGQIIITSSGLRDLPLSAAGALNLFAGTIYQGGVLRAPFGSIQLGWDGTGTAPFVNPIAKGTAPLPVTRELTLAPGSQTSVSAVDPRTGRGLIIPYGIIEGGDTWIAPSGLDITAIGPPEKRLSISAQSVTTQPGSIIDVRGGGDLLAYRFVPGTGGSQDVLNTTGSYAIVPGYDPTVAPFGPYNTAAGVFGEDPGYVNAGLLAGDQIYIGPNRGLPTGTYTLLPARYALLPGAFLVRPLSGGPIGSFSLPDGSQIVSGYRFNNLDPGTGASVQQRFELSPGSVVRQRSRYEESMGNTFFATAAQDLNLKTPRLPQDSGRLILQATSSMNLSGTVLARPIGQGRGAIADINSPLDIVIGGPGGSGPAGSLFLNAGQLNAIGAESLLIGGVRSTTPQGSAVSVNTGRLTLDNAGLALSGSDIILVAREALTLTPGSVISSNGGTLTEAENLLLGTATTAGSGNGLLVRVSSDPGATTTRSGVVAGGSPLLKVGAGVNLSGGSITLDSTAGSILDSNAVFSGNTVNLNSGQVSLLLDNPGTLQPGNGLQLAGQALASLQQRAANLNLSSYTSADFYGTGSFVMPGELRITAGQIRGFNQAGGDFVLGARRMILDNRISAASLAGSGVASGNLILQADTINLGAGSLSVDQFARVTLNAPGGLNVSGTGSFNVANDLSGRLSVITSSRGANHAITAGGALVLDGAAGTAGSPAGLGGTLLIQGRSVALGTAVQFPSGSVSVRSTAGNLLVNGSISANGTRQSIYDLVRYTNGGRVELMANGGTLNLAAGSLIDVSANPGGGDAGLLSLTSPDGALTLSGTLLGQGSSSGLGGSVKLDLQSLAATSTLSSLNAAGFSESREFRIRNGDVLVDGTSQARLFSLTADRGSVTVSGLVNASGTTGGQIALTAHGSLTLLDGSRLDVSAQRFSNAGKGGSITLESGAQRNGIVPTGTQLDLRSGAVLELGVASWVAGSATTPGSSAFNGQFNGTVHLRAPRNAAGTDLDVGVINASIRNASSLLVEGYKVYDLTATGGALTTTVQNAVRNDGITFLGTAGTATAGYQAMTNRLLQNQPGLESIMVLAPGAEVINRTGDLTLGTTGTTATADWDLSGNRFGPKSAPGVLTLRAAGDLVFYNTLSDGFAGGTSRWLAPLMALNPLLPINTQSWSYRLTAGADTDSAAFTTTLPVGSLAAGKGSLLLGKNYGAAAFVNGSNGLTATAINNGNRLQVIRTGSGGININAGRDIRLLNTFASIYTAGTQVADATTLYQTGDFSLPILDSPLNSITTVLGRQQQLYPAQYTMAGGNVSLRAGADIARYTADGSTLIDDASRQLPSNWLYRRGYVDPLTGKFGASGATQGSISVNDPAASTTWWVDYSNFFQSVGALGGGDVLLSAGNDVRNVDASSVTNARAAAGTPDAARMVELGGGNVTVKAGADILGGTYYVERGQGRLDAGGSITLEATRVGSVEAYNPRSPSLGLLSSLNAPEVTAPEAWMPTALFIGKGGFDLSASRDVLLGPVSNPFLTSSGIGNKYWYKTYFTTWSPDSYVNVRSLTGNITHRQEVTLPESLGPVPLLQAWMQSQFSNSNNPAQAASNRQPWLRLSEGTVSAFTTAASLMPGTLRSTALAGDISVVGRMNLAPAPRGSLELAAGGAFNGLNPTGLSNFVVSGQSTQVWGAARINLSDANPAAVPGMLTPLAYHLSADLNATTGLPAAQSAARGEAQFLNPLDSVFNESGSYQGVYALAQTKQSLHAAGLLHFGDPDPLRLYALGGDISGLTLFSPKATRLLAGQDISDIALYLQNLAKEDVSIIAAGRDILPYNPNSSLRSLVATAGNLLNRNEVPLPGDLQIGGPGALTILAGRKLTLGLPPALADGTGDGISSIGNLRNPFLAGDGADIILGAGIGSATGLGDSQADFEAFISQYVKGGEGQKYLTELGVTDFDSRSPEAQAQVALEVFYLILRDAGRNFSTTGNYDTGTAAIEVLFGPSAGTGDIRLSSRSLKTRSGGNISVFAPGGGLALGTSLGSSVVPPGIITESGGNISIFTKDDVDIGVLRIFTLRGGDITIWASEGNIAAGSSSKTVASAPPTRVIIDPQSADLTTDLAGLATGGGIGVLATVKNVEPGDVSLIAPLGAVDAGDAGIRSSGNLSIAAAQVLNASNIAVAGTSAGTPAAAPTPVAVSSPAPPPPPPANPNPAGEAQQSPDEAQRNQPVVEVPLSDVTVEVLGYGGSEAPTGPDDPGLDDEEEKRRRQREAEKAKAEAEAAAPATENKGTTTP